MKILIEKTVLILLALVISVSSSLVLADENESDNAVETNAAYIDQNAQINRYETISEAPTDYEINPLLAVSTFIFPSSVVTVGDAINQALSPTGYQLAQSISHDVSNTLHQPLPMVDRKLGPMPIKDVLIVLMGKSVFSLEEDPLHRLVSFKVKTSIKMALEGRVHGSN